MIESVPNISEGRRPAVLAACTEALRGVSGLRLLDVSADPSHHRAVLTYAGDADVLARASRALVQRAIALIDLRRHRGVHPRMGAVDVMPFVPLDGSTLEDCVALARRVGALLADEFAIPVFLYEAAATAPARRRLEDVRRGEFEGLRAKLADPAWTPDFGPAEAHPTAGAIAIGARLPLIAFNVVLATDRLAVAREVAAVVRERGGGLPGVKALGLPLPHRQLVQVSMNLVDYRQTPPAAAFEAVRHEAHARGVEVLESELVGLIPRAALAATTPEALRLRGFEPGMILEHRLAATRPNP